MRINIGDKETLTVLEVYNKISDWKNKELELRDEKDTFDHRDIELVLLQVMALLEKTKEVNP